MRRTFLLVIGVGFLLAANDEVPRKIQVAKTENADLPAGGTVRFKNSTGELTIEGWDQPGVELTTTKSGQRAADVKVSVTHDGNDLDFVVLQYLLDFGRCNTMQVCLSKRIEIVIQIGLDFARGFLVSHSLVGAL